MTYHQTSKCLNYIDSTFTPPYFGFFILVWAYLRHFINLRILYSLFPYSIPGFTALFSTGSARDAGLPAHNLFATVGSYDLDWPTQQYKCWISQSITFCLLAALQAVNIFWFFLICRILARIIWKGVQKDERSDDEEEEDEPVLVEEKKHEANGKPKGAQVEVNGALLGPGEQDLGPIVTSPESDRKGTLRKR